MVVLWTNSHRLADLFLTEGVFGRSRTWNPFPAEEHCVWQQSYVWSLPSVSLPLPHPSVSQFNGSRPDWEFWAVHIPLPAAALEIIQGGSQLHTSLHSSVLSAASGWVGCGVVLMFLCVALSLFILMCCLLCSRPSSARATPVLGQVRMAAMYYQPSLPCMFLSWLGR